MNDRTHIVKISRLQKTCHDIFSGIAHWRIWVLLGWQDIRVRYRRSQLGPFWITISMAVMIYSMGFLYAHLFKVELSSYFPYIAAGLLSWTFISTTIIESNDAFFEAENYIKQIKLPYTIYILRIVNRNTIIFFHNLVAVIPILFYFHVHFGFYQLLFLCFGFLVLLTCAFSYGMILGIVGMRFRDLKQVINSLVQVAFLITPIMWLPALLSEKYQSIVYLNPFSHIIDLIRAPLTGNLPSLFSILSSMGVMVVGVLLMLVLLWRTRHRISFWV